MGISPLLFSLGGQFLANALLPGLGGIAAGALGAGLGNATGQLVEGGKFDPVQAAIAAAGGGLSGVAPTPTPAAPVSGIADAAKSAVQAVNPTAAASVAPSAATAANPFTPDNMMKIGGDMWKGYTNNGLAGMAALGAQGTTAMMTPAPKGDGGQSADEAEQKAKMKNYLDNAVSFEANNNTSRYGTGSTPDSVMKYLRDTGILNGYDAPVTPSGRGLPRLFGIGRGYADGGTTPIGLGLSATINDVESQQQGGQLEQTMSQSADKTQEMFDMTVMLVTGKLSQDQGQKVFQILSESLGGPQKAQEYISQVQQSISGQGRVVAGRPSETDNVMARDANTGEPIKLASGEGILPTGMVQAAGGGLAGVKNIVDAASRRLPEIRPHASRFMANAHT